MAMELLDANGTKLNTKKEIVDTTGETISSKPHVPMTTKEIGEQLANHLILKADALPSNDLINKQLDVIYFAALNILAHRVVNLGLGFGEAEKQIVEWNPSRAFAAEKNVQEDFTIVIGEWKDKFMNGELSYHPEKS